MFEVVVQYIENDFKELSEKDPSEVTLYAALNRYIGAIECAIVCNIVSRKDSMVYLSDIRDRLLKKMENLSE